MLSYNVFPTELGYWGIAGTDRTVSAVVIGHESRQSAFAALTTKTGEEDASLDDAVDWYGELRANLQRFAQGESVNFDDVKLGLPGKLTPFQRKVLKSTRRLKYGQTVSYQQLASKVGHPGAARAVGSVMANNALPILIPCHRVLGAKGKLGGFSAPRGTSLKQELLNLEDPACAVLL